MPEQQTITRTCSKCGEVKPSSCFTFNRTRGGYEGPCKTCTKRRQAAWLRSARRERSSAKYNLPVDANEIVAAQREDLISRIKSNCIVDPVTGCREWLSAKNRKGYGMLFVNLAGTWYQIGAHRIIAAVFHGLDLRDRHRLACHHCDNCCCTEPSHIFNGSHLDNQRDAQAKGRLRGNRTKGPRPKRKPIA